MKRSTSGKYWGWSIRVGRFVLVKVAGGITPPEPLPPAEGLTNAVITIDTSMLSVG